MQEEVTFTKVKCPSCSRHLDEVKSESAVIVRKCKSCKNNIITEIINFKVVKNNIDHKSNGMDIIKPDRHIGAFKKP